MVVIYTSPRYHSRLSLIKLMTLQYRKIKRCAKLSKAYCQLFAD